jgi:putative oxidoreductase
MSLDRRPPALHSFAYAALRVMSGLVVAQHGFQKLFGWLANPGRPAPPAEMFSLMWFVGILEIVGGFSVAAGFFTRPLAFLLSGEMAVAYFWKHAPNSFFPVVNRGEPAVMLCFAFFLFAMAGAGRWSVDGMLGRGRTLRQESVPDNL